MEKSIWNNYKDTPKKHGLYLVRVGTTLDPYIAYYRGYRGYEIWGAGRKEPVTDMKVVVWTEIPGLGVCVECKKEEAVMDYNGCFHAVCGPCYEKLNKVFEEKYR